jgi:hypothetical protein
MITSRARDIAPLPNGNSGYVGSQFHWHFDLLFKIATDQH